MISREDVLSELENELDLMLADVPESVSQGTRNAIRAEALGYARRVVNSLSNEELQSEGARQRFLLTTLRDAERRMRGF